MPTLQAYGLSVDAPAGWDASIYKRQDDGFALQHLPAEQAALHAVEYQPIMHLCTKALPVVRGDMGGGVVASLGPQDVFLVLFEYGGSSLGQPLFGGTVPWPLLPDDFDTATLRTQLPGQLGCQRFFTVNGRSFMLYVVLGGTAARAQLVAQVNAALATVRVG